ncbi:Protein CBR-TAG-115 [Caenorhabditis briggsae]|uniref:Protein CBR-TAG-115 n=1 Tax=Caenorhabditis briggsae TaxID=6238 RepID=A8WQS2_CAEBR|nr:Protein CBR-TAG-115 [Caenorhabditis briggsae]CAP22830.2 Protein CBR-TAG-115 [Caenorhabditis briggsae]
MQNLNSTQTITLMEKMLPFYLETDGVCKMATCFGYNSKLHDFQLEECFGRYKQSLRSIIFINVFRWYEELNASSDVTPHPLISSAFFFRQLHRKPTLLQDLYTFRGKLSEEVFSLTKRVISSYNSNNYYRFFKLFKDLDPLLQYSLSDSVSYIRQSAMRIIYTAFKTPVSKLPSHLISDWLGFPTDTIFFVDFLQLYNVIPDNQGNVHISAIKLIEILENDQISRQF